MNRISTLILYFVALTTTFAQSNYRFSERLEWASTPLAYKGISGNTKAIFQFKGGNYTPQSANFPAFQKRWAVPQDGNLQVSLVNAQYESINLSQGVNIQNISENIIFTTEITKEREQFYAKVQFLPLRKIGNRVEKLVAFDLLASFIPNNQRRNPVKVTTTVSALSSGDIYKIAIKETGIQKIDYNFLKNDLKIASPEALNLKNLHLYGNGGGMLAENTNTDRPDDLIENAIEIVGGEDGRFDANDYILFYGVGADRWSYDEQSKSFSKPKNIYDTKSYYFLRIAATGTDGLRLSSQANLATTDYSTNAYDDFQRHEEDKVNLADLNLFASGSGKAWLGEAFSSGLRERTFSDFNFPNLITTEPVQLRAAFAGADENYTQYSINIFNRSFEKQIFPAQPNTADERFANYADRLSETFTPNNNNLSTKITFTGAASGKGWLDYIELQVRQRLAFSIGKTLTFRDVKTLAQNRSTFRLTGSDANTLVWDITNPQTPRLQASTLNGTELSFGTTTQNILREFVAFRKSDISLRPEAIGKIPNQNLHGLLNADMVVVYHKDFETAARTLAQHRQTVSGMKVVIAEISDIYNEFSSGAKDVTAVRDFARMLYLRSPSQFRYLCLLGDGSYDMRDLNTLEGQPKSNFLPTYETEESFAPIFSFPSDDYFALLSDNEGYYLRGDLDIGVGRITVKTAQEADNYIAKIIRYDTNPESFGEWRNRSAFLADNEDGNTHIRGADGIAEQVRNTYSFLNLEKIYMDAYRLDVSAGGTRVPDMNRAVFSSSFNGLLTMCYLGHGGPRGLAQERFLLTEDLAAWQNINRMPLVVTATCSFTPYDNPQETSAGETALLNKDGGAIALFSTVRAVFASSNETLTTFVFNNLFEKNTDGSLKALGDIFRKAKNEAFTGDNGQKFGFFGDPSMRLAMPRYNAVVTNMSADTFRALQKVSLSGEVKGEQGQLLDRFNGKINVILYDKVVTARTLGQDAQSPQRDFFVQRNIIFKGNATVTNGKWEIRFVVPKDIDYKMGNAKVSLYASGNLPNNTLLQDAGGAFANIVVGGTDTSRQDLKKIAPNIQLFMNEESFAFEGITDANPTLLIKLKSENGINVTGTGIGHDLTATLDGKETINLNNFYEATADDFTQGTAKYPLSKLSEGKHTIEVSAWDAANVQGRSKLEFTVVGNTKPQIQRILNYPNPFTTSTNFHVEHNLASSAGVDVRVDIFTVSGKLIKTIDYNSPTANYAIRDIAWDGRDEYGDRLARGVYLYRIHLTGTNSKGARERISSEMQKLVILK